MQVLHTIRDYPTKTTVCLVTNERERLNKSLSRWSFNNVVLCGPTRTMGHPLQMSWEHREVMDAAYATGRAPTWTCKADGG